MTGGSAIQVFQAPPAACQGVGGARLRANPEGAWLEERVGGALRRHRASTGFSRGPGAAAAEHGFGLLLYLWRRPLTSSRLTGQS